MQSADMAQLCCVFGVAAGGLHRTAHINVSSLPITVHSSQALTHGLDSMAADVRLRLAHQTVGLWKKEPGGFGLETF